MKPMGSIDFKESNCILAEDQAEYRSLPVYREVEGKQGIVISCWRLSIKERIKIFFTGKLWLKILTFKNPLQPQLPMVDNPFK